MPPSAYLVAASALIILALGAAHLWITFIGTKLYPRDQGTREAMHADHPILTRQTTIWKAWVGFNASHSIGAIFFGLVLGYLAIAKSQFLFASPFMLCAGLAMLVAYSVLGKLYWFTVPFRGIVAATVLYVTALVLAASGA